MFFPCQKETSDNPLVTLDHTADQQRKTHRPEIVNNFKYGTPNGQAGKAKRKGEKAKPATSGSPIFNYPSIINRDRRQHAPNKRPKTESPRKPTQDCTITKCYINTEDATLGAHGSEFTNLNVKMKVAKCGHLPEAGTTAGRGSTIQNR